MLNIDFVTDFVCPYCIVAREAIDQAMEELRLPPSSVAITYHPLELTPPEKEQIDTWNDPVRRARYHDLDEACEDLALRDVHFPPKVVPRPRTRLAWEASLFAEQSGRAGAWNACMYRAYFIYQEDIGDPALLLRYARVLGLDADALQKAWDEHTFTGELLRREANARAAFDPHGIPTIWCNGRRLNLTSYTRGEMVDQLMGAAQEQPADPACGADGCR